MIAKLISALFFLVGSAALAIPSEGDYAALDLTQSDSRGFSRSGLYEISISDFDPVDHTFLQTITITWDGQPSEVHQNRYYENQYPNESQIQNVLSHCANYGGDLVDVNTGRGLFQSCAVPVQENGFSGINFTADVPFGYAKLTRSDVYGRREVYMLRDFRTGLSNTPTNGLKKIKNLK
jgi:hypothetical protein